MTTFDILKKELDLHQRCFVEASAGCGKTFSIENIVTRLVMDEKKPLDIEKILVLTFTKEATSELKARIRKSIETVKNQLENSCDSHFEYVQAYFSEKKDQKKKVIQNLQEALAKFDLAQIFTIHKFCFLMLKQFLFEAKIKLSEDIEESSVSLKTYEGVVRDYLGFGVDQEILGKPQIKLLLHYFKNDLNALLQTVVMQLTKELRVLKPKSWREIKKACENEIEVIRKDHSFSYEEITHLYENAASLFKGGANRQNEISRSLKEAISHLASFLVEKKLDEFIESYQIFRKVFDESNLKKSAAKALDQYLAFTTLHEKLNNKLFLLLDMVVKKENLIAALCHESQKFLTAVFEKNNILTPNNILTKFCSLVNKKEIAQSIREQYQAVIVDEFQDTDPIQWQILSKLFIHKTSTQIPFYLVGDPKQSIYGFRRADIYTYLKAAEMLNISSVSTLNINYRSQPGLIDALNALFAKERDRWLALPKLNSFLTYREVQSFSQIEKKDFQDSKKSIHFILAEQKEKISLVPSKQLEEKVFFPFFVNEILRLHHELKMPFRSFAILVRDRFQASRLKEFLKKHRLPFMSTRPESLQGLFTIESFLQIYIAALHPKKSRYIFALKLNAILQLPEFLFEESKTNIFDIFSSLRDTLFEKGFLAFYQELMDKPIFSKQSINEQLLSQEEGLYQYLELEQMKDLLLQEEVSGADPYQLLKTLKELSVSTALPEKVYPLRQNFEEDGLQILTLHMSKGLEFEVVFALGLVNQVKKREDLIFDVENEMLIPSPLLSDDSFLNYQQEQEAEKMRQLYVAMTRAKQRLYLPCVTTTKDVDSSISSPMESFLKHIHLDKESLIDFISKQKEISYTICEDEIDVIDLKEASSKELVKPSSLTRSFLKEYKHSFTSLASSHVATLLDLKAPIDYSNLTKTIHTLPAGPDTGILFHKILEKMNFNESDIEIDEFIVHTKFEPWKEVIQSTLLKLLKAPITTPSGTFSLCELQSNQILKEVEFFYPLKGSEKIEGLTQVGDYMQGFIDLVCCYKDKYYLIDYKTNWLGPCNRDYLDLREPMKNHQYFLQADIYQEALKKYLNLFDEREFKACFGGTLYWFLRGVEAENNGLFFV